MMELVKSKVFEFYTRTDQEFNEVSVTSPCNFSNLCTNAFITIWQQVTDLAKRCHCKRLKKGNWYGAENIPFGMAFENVWYHSILFLNFIHKCVVALTISSGNFNFPDVSSISLFADKTCVNFCKQILFYAWSSVNKKVSQMVANWINTS